MKSVAYLNNHTTAAAWALRVFSELRVATYIPLLCAEVGALSGSAARQARTSRLRPRDEELLDSMDVYSPELTIDDRYTAALDRNFCAVIFPGAVRTPNLQFIAERCRVPIVIYEWGDVGGVIFHEEYVDVARRRDNIKVAVAYEAFSSQHVHLPLGLPRDLLRSDFEIQEYERPTYALVASRLYHPQSYTYDQVSGFLEGVDGRDCDLLVIGKDHQLEDPNQLFRQGWSSVHLLSDLSRERLCSTLASVDSLLYWMQEQTVVQLSPFESASLGTPVIYRRSTMLSTLLPDDDSCRASSGQDISRIMRELNDPEIRSQRASRQRDALQPLMADGPQKWSSILPATRSRPSWLPARRTR